MREAVGEWPKAADKQLFVEGANCQPRWLESQAGLFAWLAERLATDGDNGILWADRGESMIGRGQFYESLRHNCEQYEAVEAVPHFPEMPRFYYMHPAVKVGTGEHLERFLAFFSPCTPIDGQLLKAFVVTLAWGGPCGKRPAWMITGPESDPHGGRGVGKTSFVERCAGLFGGVIAISDAGSAKSEEIDRRLLSLEGRPKRVLLIDNLKALQFSWSYVEGIITAEMISGRQMYVGEGRRPNALSVVITANGASLSRDMAQRCNVVKLARPTYSAGDWDDQVSDFVASHRWDIIADIAAFFRKPASPIESPSRWGLWQQAVLARLDDPDAVQRLLEERSKAIDGDTEEADLVRSEIRGEIRSRFHDPDSVRAKISARALAGLVNRAMGTNMPTNKATAYVKTLAITEMSGHSRRGGRYYYWNGKGITDPDARAACTIDVVDQRSQGTPDDDAGDAGDG
jgi:hypothetical protein